MYQEWTVMPSPPATREAWLSERKKHIGGSDVAVMLGLSEYKTPYQLWEEKTGRASNTVDNKATRRGIILEPAIARYFKEETGLALLTNQDEAPRSYIHPAHNFMSVTPDGMIMSGPHSGVYEAKSTRAIIDKENLPLTWFCQLTWGIGILHDLREVDGTANYLAWIDGTMTFDNQLVNFDPQFYQFLIDKAGEFWKYVTTDTPPPAMNAEDTERMFRKAISGKTIEATPDLLHEFEELRMSRQAMKEAEQKKDEIEDRIKMILKDSEGVMYAGKLLCTWKNTKDRDKFMIEKFRAEYPEMAAKFTTTEPGSRRFLLK